METLLFGLFLWVNRKLLHLFTLISLIIIVHTHIVFEPCLLLIMLYCCHVIKIEFVQNWNDK